MQKQCEVCAEHAAKYKCPQCVIKYCSVNCYKTHRETRCIEKKKEVGAIGSPVVNSSSGLEMEEGELMEVHDVTEDRVDDKILQTLEHSEELRLLLRNPHLRVMMTALTQTDEPGKLIDKAMREPIFTEFADECLKIVDPDKT